MSAALAVVLDLTLVVALALVATSALRRRSASARHAVLAAGLLAAASVPGLEMLVPAWEVPIAWGARTQAVSSTLTLTSAPATEDGGAWTEAAQSFPFPWLEAVGIVWAAGALVILGGLITGLVRLARETRRCTVIRSGPWRDLADRLSAGGVTLLQSDSRSLLLTWGHVRPKILLPSGAGAWIPERRVVVLTHELAHVRRGDWALQLGAECLRAVYWFHPLVLIACRRLRHEGECACDDAVLDAGVEPARYATHLLDLARQSVADRQSWASVPAVANRSTLERRISAMLHDTGNRTPLTRRARACAAAAAIVVAAPIAAVAITEPSLEPAVPPTAAVADVDLVAPSPDARIASPVPSPDLRAPAAAAAVAAQQSLGSVSGVLSDSSGGILPGVALTLTGAQTGTVYQRRSDGNGAFTFADLPPGRYTLTAVLPGFLTLEIRLDLGAGEHLQRRLSMPIGGVQETIAVLCGSGGAALLAPARLGVISSLGRAAARAWPLFPGVQDAPRAQDAPAAAQLPVRVGGNVRAPRKVRDARPICPPTLSPSFEGTAAILEAVIGPDGKIHDVSVLRQPSLPELAESAIEAIRQWEFTPTLLNNVPVPIIMTVTVVFQRE